SLMNRNDFSRKVINYLLIDMENKILRMRLFMLTKKLLICIWVSCQCVMENCKGKMCSIVKNCCGCKISFQSICRSSDLIYNVEKKVRIGSILKRVNLKNKR